MSTLPPPRPQPFLFSLLHTLHPAPPRLPKVMKELVDASSLKPEIVDGVDIMVVRELTGDVYFGTPKVRTCCTHYAGRVVHRSCRLLSLPPFTVEGCRHD